MVSYQKFWVYEQRHTFLKLMLILWYKPSDFFCTHLVIGESHTFANAASHHLPHRCISCSCVRERKPPLADPWAWSAVHFNSPSYVSVNSTPKMETWESCFLTAMLQWAEKLREWDAHPGSASVTTTLLLSTRARGCVSKAASIQGWPCGSAISSSYKLTHDLRSQFSSCCPLCFSFWVWVSVRRTSPLVLPRGQTFLSFMQAKFSCCIHELRQTGKPYEEGPGWFLSH